MFSNSLNWNFSYLIACFVVDDLVWLLAIRIENFCFLLLPFLNYKSGQINVLRIFPLKTFEMIFVLFLVILFYEWLHL